MSHPGGPQEVLVLGDYRQTVTAVRSLARAGFAVILGISVRRSSLPYRLGLDFPLFAIELAAYRRARNMGLDGTGALREPSALEAPYPVGQRYHWLCGDFGAWIECLRRRRQRPRELAAWALDMLWRSALDSHLTWDVLGPKADVPVNPKRRSARPPRARRYAVDAVVGVRHGALRRHSAAPLLPDTTVWTRGSEGW